MAEPPHDRWLELVTFLGVLLTAIIAFLAYLRWG